MGQGVAEIIDRMKRSTGARTDDELAAWLERRMGEDQKLSRQTVSSWRAKDRQTVPWPYMAIVAKETGVGLDYLALLEAEPRLRPGVVRQVETEVRALTPDLRVVVEEVSRAPALVACLRALGDLPEGAEIVEFLAGMDREQLGCLLKLFRR